MNRADLADFLRTRREALQPADVGIGAGQRRRAPGLRREEVALLAGMSTDYYARLEQQRAPQPSEQMLTSIARALRLTLDERDHLYLLAGHNPPSRVRRSEHVAPALLRVLDRLHDTPALVVSDLGVTLAQNAMSLALNGDEMHFTGPARSAVFRWFTDPAARARYPERDHAHQSRVQAANLRAAVGGGAGEADARALVEELVRQSAEFRSVWAAHEVARRFDDHKTLVHPELGEIEVDCQPLFTENAAQALLVLTPRAGTDAADKLRLLQVVGVTFAG
ncbi:helix-turn-helix transcriptional regulator [Herbiconiux daphne]|uniref:Helix-turn-helix transcriptional regulator n=1 Tax=Herbiconiux daphne TaxID=2970914 RepID=A0ABT2H7S9_9MICO|nr:helix-turn-helix transcriptional regulator [Herbiconiux daphne]MCS5735995.1 helix-turn-helix transcriptional regulator [Herbiconiux daphne]